MRPPLAWNLTHRFYDGLISQLMLYDTALSDEQVASLYEAYTGGTSVASVGEPVGGAGEPADEHGRAGLISWGIGGLCRTSGWRTVLGVKFDPALILTPPRLRDAGPSSYSPSQDGGSGSSSGLSGGAIAGIVIGVLAGVAVLGGLAVFAVQSHRRKRGTR